jgi:hypothetical protein
MARDELCDFSSLASRKVVTRASALEKGRWHYQLDLEKKKKPWLEDCSNSFSIDSLLARSLIN